MANSWDQMRKAGASGRAMLVSAAAKRWNVGAAEIVVRDGIVSHAGSGRKASFGELALDAAKETVPTEVKLKDPKDFRLIGKQAKRKDSAAKTNGTAQFTQDVFLPGMLVAVVAHPPQFGATVKSFDASKAKAIKGVVDVVQIPQGVAVLATRHLERQERARCPVGRVGTTARPSSWAAMKFWPSTRKWPKSPA